MRTLLKSALQPNKRRKITPLHANTLCPTTLLRQLLLSRTSRYAMLLALAICATGNALAQEKLTTIGHIEGTIDGKAQKWETFRAKVGKETVTSANWRRNTYSMPDYSEGWAAMAEQLPPEQRAQFEAIMKQAGANNPMAEMMAQMTGQPIGNPDAITVSITGMDPSSNDKLRERLLSLEVMVADPDNVKTGTPRDADITYIVEASSSAMPQILYVSDHDQQNALVTFETLTVHPDSGHAAGTFSARLCRVDMKNLFEGPDMEDCFDASGRFDTALAEE